MSIPDQFFTVQSMCTLTGASGVTFLICNSLQRALNFNPKWLALAIALALSLIGTCLAGKRDAVDYFVGFVNGFLIYATAAGGTEIMGGANRTNRTNVESEDDTYGASRPRRQEAAKRRFSSSWFH